MNARQKVLEMLRTKTHIPFRKWLKEKDYIQKGMSMLSLKDEYLEQYLAEYESNPR